MYIYIHIKVRQGLPDEIMSLHVYTYIHVYIVNIVIFICIFIHICMFLYI